MYNNIGSKINITLLSSVGIISLSMIKDMEKIENKYEKIKVILKKVNLIGLLAWPVIFDKIIGYNKLLNRKSLILPFTFPLLRGFLEFNKLSNIDFSSNKQREEYFKKINNEKTATTVTTQIISFTYFLNLISNKCKYDDTSSFNIILSTYLMGFITEFISDSFISSDIGKEYIYSIKQIINTYSIVILIIISMTHSFESNSNKKNDN